MICQINRQQVESRNSLVQALIGLHTLNNAKAKDTEQHSNYLKVTVTQDLLHISECLRRKHVYSASLLIKIIKKST